MVDEKGKSDENAWPDDGQHEEFLELCAISTTENLSEEERKKLGEHLAVCATCRKVLKEFEDVVDRGVPALASELASEVTSEPLKENSSFSQADAETSFFRRLSEEKERSAEELGEADGWVSPLVVRRSRNFRRSLDRYHFWLPLAAGALLCLSLGILTYRMGKNRGFAVARRDLGVATPAPAISQEALAAAIQARDAANYRLAERDRRIADLQREVARESSDNMRLKDLQKEQSAALVAGAGEKEKLNVERDRLAQQAALTEAALEASEGKLHKLERGRSEDILHAGSLEKKVAELSRIVTEQQQNISEEHELLAKDRDIRELMGARDLYITEVHDVAKTGETQKPFGRVFYTKGKSLIFYAYDLNEKPDLKEGGTFQAWGRRGPDWEQAFSLGMFYEDNASKKRWVVKFNDKRALDQIDAVFVTVEPHNGSERPTGKPFLFAYLKVKANHP
jgi:Anti-sigma-K factor rskA